ncbi:benzoate 4-monooxygenase [Periconia macrospinosa]|uniref:Benzoate 4-monooxygenase n=1 Tax=Periconia macrospinosa TaxID=97972 RepID=A0A2V1D7P7_9PLEO|nr:benzoate 4-monooxygenase [Periconia macrospinosa]
MGLFEHLISLFSIRKVNTFHVIYFSLAAVVVYLVLSVVWNLFFHPLRRFPGPLLARASTIWYRIAGFQANKAHWIHAAHSRYGPVIRVAPNELSFADPAAVRQVYTSKEFVKAETFYRAKTIYHENHVFSIRNIEDHHSRRRLLNKGFSLAALTDFESSLSIKIRTLLDQWAMRTRENPTIEVYPWLYYLSFDTIYHLLFGVDPECVKTGQSHEVMQYMTAWRMTYIYKELIPSLERWGIFMPATVGDTFRKVRKWKFYAMEVVRSARMKDAKTPFLQNVLHGEDSSFGRPLNDSELAEECMGAMFGGTGTTANSFIYLLWATLQIPEVVKSLQQELRMKFPDRKTVPDFLACSKLPYVQAVISETLRLYPTIIGTQPRTATEDALVCGVVVPKGTTVGIQNYTIHRNADAFPDPESFRPSRWLETNSEASLNKMREVFVPFSVGRHACLGKTLAEFELTVLVAAFFLRFDATVDPTMLHGGMKMEDRFSAAPIGRSLVLRMQERLVEE